MTAGGPSVVVIDYGSGNLRSAERALAEVGANVVVTSDMAAARDADGVVLPGVGAFAACMAGIHDVGADDVVRQRVEAGHPVLGICVGMQVMYDGGREHGIRTPGIGVLSGNVVQLEADVLPHMGWDTVVPPPDSALFAGVEDERFYFVHSYAARAHDPSDAAGETVSEHGSRFVAAVESGVISATQFHPEKSGAAGLRLLKNWVAVVAARS
ncbi:MAG: imidazole glycerol phosphate synthase subunit HisH [Frankiaceae bacterium]|nr:imidazole glycerol phosphate synthase subunit HisH [Frankiaceae bacterium]